MEDTIVAISTVLGNSAINIVRVTGTNSIKKVSKFFHGKDLNKVKGNTINYGKFVYENEIIDEVLISVFKEGHSFTKEEMVEINTHGGVVVANKILEILLENDIRLAEPGEFTKRAFLNGRIDIVEAESISDLISAESESARKLSIQGINGNISKLIKELRSDIIEVLGNIEVNIDYPEYEDIEEMTLELLKEKINKIDEKLLNIEEESKKSKVIKNGINVAIVGRPNTGKSSILNKLIGEDKAIVTNIEGTTRDIVEGSIILNGIKVNLIDTAGIRETENIVEKIGVERSIKAISTADLVLVVLNNNEKITKKDKEIIEKVEDKKKLFVVNKSDLNKKIDLDEKYILVNTVEKDGLKPLEKEIIKLFNLNKINTSNYTFLSNERQISILKECIKIINNIKKGIEKETPIDLIQIDITALWNKLGEIIGDTYEDELLDEIFSKFCLGK